MNQRVVLRQQALLIVLFLMIAAGGGAAVYLLSSHGPIEAPVEDSARAVQVPAEVLQDAIIRERLEPESNEGRVLTVQVHSEERQALAGATVSVAADGFTVWRMANGSGSCAIPLPESDEILLSVSADGHCSEQRWLRTPYPQVVEFALSKEVGEIRGRVALSDGSPPPFEVTVFAWPRSIRPPLGAFSAGGGGALPSATTTPQGEFEITDLRPSTVYSVGAGALGWATSELVWEVSPGAEPLQLELWRIMACIAEVREVDGTVPSIGSAFANVSLRDHAVDYSYSVSSRSLDWSLARLDFVPGSGDFDWRKYFVAYKVAKPVDSIDAEIQYDVPGFKASKASVTIVPVSNAIPVREVTLSRNAEGFGSLRVYLQSLHDALNTNNVIPPLRALPRLLLVPDGNDGRALEVQYFDAGESIREIRDIPFGNYHALLLTPFGRFPPGTSGKPVQIGPLSAAVEFDLTELGGVVVEILGKDGSATDYVGPLLLELQPEGRGVKLPFSFAGPPYAVSGLRPGSYSLKVASVGEAFLDLPFQIDIQEGTLAKLSCPVR